MYSLEDWLTILKNLTNGTEYYADYNGRRDGVSIFRIEGSDVQIATHLQ